MLGVGVSSFAYPFGRFDARSHSIARKYFACAVSDRLGWVRPRSDPFALERLDAYYLKNEKLFSLMPTLWLRWYILVRRIPRDLWMWRAHCGLARMAAASTFSIQTVNDSRACNPNVMIQRPSAATMFSQFTWIDLAPCGLRHRIAVSIDLILSANSLSATRAKRTTRQV